MSTRARSRITFIAAALLLAVLVHADWHLGRPGHHRLSGDWSLHWLTGALTGAGLAFRAVRAAGSRALAWFTGVVLLGFFFGQIVEPAAELLYDDMTLALIMPAVRIRIFCEFAAALLVGGVATLLLERAASASFATLR